MLLGILWPVAGWGATCYVDRNANGARTGTSWANAFTNIQAGIQAANANGDVVEISGGNYAENLQTVRDVRATIRGSLEAGHKGPVVVSAVSSHALYVHHSGHTFERIVFQGAAQYYFNLYASVSARFNDCVFRNGWMAYRGAGDASVFNRCDFSGHPRTDYFADCDGATFSPTFNYCRFMGNAGGFLFKSGVAPKWNNCLFIGNGWRTLHSVTGPQNPVVNNCIFAGNISQPLPRDVLYHSGTGTFTVNNSLLLPCPLYPDQNNWIGITEGPGARSNRYTLPAFRRGAFPGILVMGIDDYNNLAHWTNLATIAEGYGMRLVFALNTTNTPASTWATLQPYVNRGHEIASHSVSHTNLTTLTDAQLAAELSESKATIEQHLTGYVCKVLVPPYSTTDQRVQLAAKAAGYIGARGLPAPDGDTDLSNCNVFNILTLGASPWSGPTNLVRNTAALCEWLTQNGRIAFLYDHGPAAFSVEKWTAVFDIVARSGVRVMTLSEAVEHINNTRTGYLPPGTIADTNGLRWTRTLVDASDYRLQPSSPCKDAGDNAVWSGVTNITDYLGTLITDGGGNLVAPGGQVDIGAYELYQGRAFFYPPVALSGNMVVSWEGLGTLEGAASIRGPWTTRTNQNNPQTVPMTGSQFFRIRQ